VGTFVPKFLSRINPTKIAIYRDKNAQAFYNLVTIVDGGAASVDALGIRGVMQGESAVAKNIKIAERAPGA